MNVGNNGVQGLIWITICNNSDARIVATPVPKHLALISILASASCWHCCCCCYCPDFIHLLITTMDFWDHQTDFGDSWGFKFQSEQVALKSLK